MTGLKIIDGTPTTMNKYLREREMKIIKEKIRAEVLKEVEHKHQISLQCAREGVKEDVNKLIDNKLRFEIGQYIIKILEELKAEINDRPLS